MAVSGLAWCGIEKVSHTIPLTFFVSVSIIIEMLEDGFRPIMAASASQQMCIKGGVLGILGAPPAPFYNLVSLEIGS